MFIKVALLSNLFAAALAQISVGCYPLGAGGATDCAQFINNFCNIASKDQVIAGDSTGHCYNLPNGNRCDFMAFNSRTVTGPPSLTSCQNVLKQVTTQCGLGGSGRTSDTAYTFIVDPNSGRCG